MPGPQIDIFTLPSVPLADCTALPECPAVYFVLAERKVLYVGKTKQLRTRWKTHQLLEALQRHKEVSIAWYVAVDSILRWKLENRAAEIFRPPYNKALIPRVQTHKSVSAFVPNHFYAILQTLADREGSSMSHQVKTLLREALEVRGMLILDP